MKWTIRTTTVTRSSRSRTNTDQILRKFGLPGIREYIGFVHRKFLIFISIGTLLSSCAVGYKPKGLGGGYYDYPSTTENRYIVGFVGNDLNDSSTIIKYTRRRALELCKEKGLDGFKIIDKGPHETPTDKSKFELLIECR